MKLLRQFISTIHNHGPAPSAEEYRNRYGISAANNHNTANTATSAPLVSIITVVRNAVDSVEKSICSVLEQNYQPLEYIIVDGASTDGTLEILKRYEDQVTIIISEPDTGIYDAFNKGYVFSTGSYIGYLNADDWMSAGQISAGISLIKNTAADFSYGDMKEHNQLGMGSDTAMLRAGDPEYANKISFSMPELFQTTWLCSRQIFENIGLFRTNFHIASDYDWILRAHKAGFIGAYSDKICGNMRFGGISTTQQGLSILESYYISVNSGGSWIAATRHWAPLLLRNIRRQMLSLLSSRL